MILGSLFPEKFSAIAAYVPSSVIYGSLINPDKPAWLYQGKPLAPSAPFPFTAAHLQAHTNREIPIALTPFFLEGMKDRELFEQSAILVEKLRCPLLLISGQRDQMWPSTLFTSQIEERLRIKNSSIPCFHYSYPKSGHSLAPCSHRTHVGKVHSIDHFLFDFGGNLEDDSRASLDAWEKTLHFFYGFSKKILVC